MSDLPWQNSVGDRLGTFLFMRENILQAKDRDGFKHDVLVPDIYFCGGSTGTLRDVDYSEMPAAIVVKTQKAGGSKGVFVLPDATPLRTGGAALDLFTGRNVTVEHMIKGMAAAVGKYETSNISATT